MKRLLLLLVVVALPAPGCDVFLSSGNPPCWYDEDCAEDQACAAGVCVHCIPEGELPAQSPAIPANVVRLADCSFSFPSPAGSLKQSFACAVADASSVTAITPVFFQASESGKFETVPNANIPFDSMIKDIELGLTYLSADRPFEYVISTENDLYHWTERQIDPLQKIINNSPPLPDALLAASAERDFLAAASNNDLLLLTTPLAPQDPVEVSVRCDLPAPATALALRTIPGGNFLSMIVSSPSFGGAGIDEFFFEDYTQIATCGQPRPVDNNFDPQQGVHALSVSHGGVLLAAVLTHPGNDEEILRVYADHEGNWSELFTVDGTYASVAFSPVERDAWVLAAGRKDGMIEFFEVDEDPEGPDVVPFLVLDALANDGSVIDKKIQQVVFSPDGRLLAVVSDRFIKIYPTLGITHGDR